MKIMENLCVIPNKYNVHKKPDKNLKNETKYIK